MSSTSNRPEDNGADQGPRDWRRRRRGRPQREQQAADQSERPNDVQQNEDVALSPSLVSYLKVSLSRPLIESAVDTVGVYSAPLLLAGIVGLVTGITVVAFVTSMRVYGYIDIGIGAALIALVGAVFISNVTAAFLSRSGRYGVNTVVILGAFAAIVVILNVISFENTNRMDVTATNQFSLSFRTQDLLKDLDTEVRATAFYKEIELSGDVNVALRRNRVEETLEEFDSRSGNFSYRIIDPDLKPEVVAKYFGARPTGFVEEIVVIENLTTGQFDTLAPQEADISFTQLEQDLVTSTYIATGQDQKTIYFLAGHGERDLISGEQHGYDLVREGLEGESYNVMPLVWNPAESNVEVPDNAALVVIAGPTSNLPEGHQIALDLYLHGRTADGGVRRESGSMIFLAEPDTPASFLAFLAGWGVLVSPGYIRDLDRSAPGLPQTLDLAEFNPDQDTLEIVAPKGQQLQSVFMPGATALQVLREGSALAVTSPNSYLIADPERTDPVTDGENADPKGRFIPAIRIEAVGKIGSTPPIGEASSEQISNIIVFGDSDFLANSGYARGGGADMFLNSANFLVGDFSLVSIRPKTFAFREFNLDNNEYDFVRFSSWLFLPGIMALMAGIVWWVRR